MLKVTSTRPATASSGAVPLICFEAGLRAPSRKDVPGLVVILVISSRGLLRYGIKGMLKGVPAIIVWIGPAPDADGDGATLGEPLAEGRESEADDGNTFDVGMTSVDPGAVPTSLDG